MLNIGDSLIFLGFPDQPRVQQIETVILHKLIMQIRLLQ